MRSRFGLSRFARNNKKLKATEVAFIVFNLRGWISVGLFWADHIDRLKPLRSLFDLELDGLILEESTTTVSADLGIVDENVGPAVLLDEAPAFFVVEPLHFTNCHETPPLHIVPRSDERGFFEARDPRREVETSRPRTTKRVGVGVNCRPAEPLGPR